MTSALAISWDESATIQAMETMFDGYEDVQSHCDEVRLTPYWIERWGFNWTRSVSCSELCRLDDLLNHKTWGGLPGAGVSHYDIRQAACWTDFKQFGQLRNRYTSLQFMENSGQWDLFLITAKNDWMVDHANQTTENRVDLVPQGGIGVITFNYLYRLASRPSWFPFTTQHTAPLRGSNAQATTIILDARGHPVGDPILPGHPIAIEVNDAFVWSERPDGSSPHRIQ